MEQKFTFEDMKSINRPEFGNMVPLELFRTIRLIGLHDSLPMKGKSTTNLIGKEIGKSLPVKNLDDILKIYEDLKIGKPVVLEQTEKKIILKMDECFCSGLPETGDLVCDLEGAMLEGALHKITNKQIKVRETKCNVHGDTHCEYECTLY